MQLSDPPLEGPILRSKLSAKGAVLKDTLLFRPNLNLCSLLDIDEIADATKFICMAASDIFT